MNKFANQIDTLISNLAEELAITVDALTIYNGSHGGAEILILGYAYASDEPNYQVIHHALRSEISAFWSDPNENVAKREYQRQLSERVYA